LGVKLGPVVGLHAVVSCVDAASCASLARSFGEARDSRTGGIAAHLPGASALLARIQIVADGKWVHARLDLPAEQAASLAEGLAALQHGMRHGHPAPEPAAVPPVPPPRPDEVVTPSAGKDGGAGSGAPDAGGKR